MSIYSDMTGILTKLVNRFVGGGGGVDGVASVICLIL